MNKYFVVCIGENSSTGVYLDSNAMSKALLSLEEANKRALHLKQAYPQHDYYVAKLQFIAGLVPQPRYEMVQL